MGKLIYTGNELSVHNPELVEEWDFDKNFPITPDDVTFGSDRKVWWKCKICGFNWETTVSHRVHGRNCPACSNKTIIVGKNDLATNIPSLLKEWNDERNGDLKPTQISVGSNRAIWWKCAKGHEWQASPYTRSKGIGCPICANKKVLKGYNDLLFKCPEIAKEWNYEKNPFSPDEVVFRSEKKAWWKCSVCGHEWQTTISSRYYGTGCPKCNYVGTSFSEQAVFYYISQLFNDAVNRYVCDGFEFDIYLPSIKTAIEYDGLYFHSKINSIEKDNKKDLFCKANGIRLIRLRDEKLSNTNYATIIKCVDDNKKELEKAIKELLSLLKNNDYININIESDRQKIIAIYHKNIVKNSLALLHPDLIKEWDFEKNYPLTPDKVTSGSNHKVWWRCPKCKNEWQATPNTRTRGYGCAVCAGRKVIVGFNDLATTNPELAKQWDYRKNGDLTPQKITKGSHKKVWWICEKCGNSWEATIHNRGKGNNCPICGLKKSRKTQQLQAAKRNNLLEKFPNVASEWNNIKNIEPPENYACSSNKKVWWICHYCGNEFESQISTRTRNGDNYGCLNCKRKHRKKQLP